MEQIEQITIEPELKQEIKTISIEEVPVESVSVGPVSINYGSVWLDALAGSVVVILLVIGYYWKKKIDKKFK